LAQESNLATGTAKTAIKNGLSPKWSWKKIRKFQDYTFIFVQPAAAPIGWSAMQNIYLIRGAIMSNENLPTIINYEDAKVIATLKQTVAKGATDSEFEMFLGHCKGTGLNPFKKEIWFIKTNQGVQIMTGINGYYAVANSHPEFDGIETETIEEDGKLIKAVCRVYRKDRSRPMTAQAYFCEFGKAFGNWKVMPRYMLEKCAESIALRKAFPQELNGSYTREEMPEQFASSAERLELVPSTPVFDPNKPYSQQRMHAHVVATTEQPGDHVIIGNGAKLQSIGKRIKDIPREKLLKAVQEPLIAAKLSESDLDAIVAYLGETEKIEPIPYEQDEIPNFDHEAEAA
jgi:phage recombination protein Bet